MNSSFGVADSRVRGYLRLRCIQWAGSLGDTETECTLRFGELGLGLRSPIPQGARPRVPHTSPSSQRSSTSSSIGSAGSRWVDPIRGPTLKRWFDRLCLRICLAWEAVVLESLPRASVQSYDANHTSKQEHEPKGCSHMLPKQMLNPKYYSKLRKAGSELESNDVLLIAPDRWDSSVCRVPKTAMQHQHRTIDLTRHPILQKLSSGI